jgi:RNA 2',3'-cyclic 3'-phosphodiesterase
VRLFVALELPVDVRAALSEWAARHVAGSDGLRLVQSDSLHVTLCFLGSVAATEIDALAVACGLATGSPRPVLAVGQPAWLPPRRPGVLAVDLDDAGGALAGLQAKLSAVLADGGWYEPERRPFRPHVTVARVRRGTRARPPELPPPAPLRFVGSSVALMRSRPGSGGARYERLATVLLGPDGAATAGAGSRSTFPAPGRSRS